MTLFTKNLFFVVKELETFPVIIIDIVFKSYRVAFTYEILRPKSPFSYLKIFERQKKKKSHAVDAISKITFGFSIWRPLQQFPIGFIDFCLQCLHAFWDFTFSSIFSYFINLKCSKSLEFHVRKVVWRSPHTHLTLPLTSLFTFTSHLHCVASNCAISVVI